MKPRWNVHIGHLIIELGWFSGEPFKLLSATLLEISEGWWTLVDLHVAKLMITVSIEMQP